LSSALTTIQSIAPENGLGAEERLAARLKSNSRAAHPTFSDEVTTNGSREVTITYAPAYDQTHALAKAASFDTRIAILESLIGLDALPLATQSLAHPQSLLPTLDTLSRQITLLSTTTPSSLDSLASRIRSLTSKADSLTTARKAAKAANEALLTSQAEAKTLNTTSAELHHTIPSDPEHTSRIAALYALLPTIESLSPLLPSTLDRLRSLQLIHADAASASQSLARVEKRQEEVDEEIKAWSEGLVRVEEAVAEGEVRMRENARAVEGWVKELEGRMGVLRRGVK
jgi:nuclear migration protein JNM1